MKIGIYSGCFDPLTNGHLWVIEEAAKLFDRVYVAIGSHPHKTPTFAKAERQDMIEASLKHLEDRVHVVRLMQDIVSYTLSTERHHGGKPNCSVALVRGIRDKKDFDYEAGIIQNIRLRSDKISQVYLIPPTELAEVSSTEVRNRYFTLGAEAVEDLVPGPVLAELKKLRRWIVTTPDVSSIFETTTAGFAPAPSETFASIHDDFLKEIPINPARYTREFFDKLVANGFIAFAPEVSAEAVRAMLDDAGVDVVSSARFHLRSVPVDRLSPTGDRYLRESMSLGPIIVDRKTDGLAGLDIRGRLGGVVVIEGKHRWLAAKEAGRAEIMAWVGEDALEELGLEVL
jgi:pantetheine-phosphate adenylyltransferase